MKIKIESINKPIGFLSLRQHRNNPSLRKQKQAGGKVQWVSCLPCTWLTWLQFPAAHKIPWALPGMILECKIRNKALILPGEISKQNKTKPPNLHWLIKNVLFYPQTTIEGLFIFPSFLLLTVLGIKPTASFIQNSYSVGLYLDLTPISLIWVLVIGTLSVVQRADRCFTLWLQMKVGDWLQICLGYPKYMQLTPSRTPKSASCSFPEKEVMCPLCCRGQILQDMVREAMVIKPSSPTRPWVLFGLKYFISLLFF